MYKDKRMEDIHIDTLTNKWIDRQRGKNLIGEKAERLEDK
jgi:hypothetical protein